MALQDIIIYLTTGPLAPIWSPAVFAALLVLAVMFFWMAVAPGKGRRSDESDRLAAYLSDDDAIPLDELNRPFVSRAVLPLFRRVLRALGKLTPSRQIESTEKMLMHAGRPAGLTAIDFFGLRVLVPVVFGLVALLLFATKQPAAIVLRNTIMLMMLGYVVPRLWLRTLVRRRKHEIARALPDALDMMTIGVEAGLAFESAMLRVGDQWDNALTREFARAIGEMRVGTPRSEALQRMAERAGVEELHTFVTVLIQSSQLGVTIAQVLHTQSADMRVRRRQRAEELARQASVKMIFPLICFIFPAIMVVLLGPSLPRFAEFFAAFRSGGDALSGL